MRKRFSIIVKKILFIFIFFFILLPIYSKIVSSPFTNDTFEIKLSDFPKRNIKKPQKNSAQHYQYSFINNSKTFEIRYTLFKETNDIINQDTRIAVYMWVKIVALNIAGDESLLNDIVPFNDQDVANDFNGDFGFTTYISNAKSDFTKKYKFIMLNFYYKKTYGIVCQSILFNDINDLKTEEYIKYFHSFSFQDLEEELADEMGYKIEEFVSIADYGGNLGVALAIANTLTDKDIDFLEANEIGKQIGVFEKNTFGYYGIFSDKAFIKLLTELCDNKYKITLHSRYYEIPYKEIKDCELSEDIFFIILRLDHHTMILNEVNWNKDKMTIKNIIAKSLIKATDDLPIKIKAGGKIDPKLIDRWDILLFKKTR